MIKEYWKYLPNLKESWLLLLIMIVGGGVLGTIITLFINLAVPGLSGWSTVISYPVLFLPPALYIYFRVKFMKQENPYPLTTLNSEEWVHLCSFCF